MPLHRNESSQQKTLTLKGEHVFVKENHALSRERASSLTVVSNAKDLQPDTGLLFKGVGSVIKKTLEILTGMNVQFAPKGS